MKGEIKEEMCEKRIDRTVKMKEGHEPSRKMAMIRKIGD